MNLTPNKLEKHGYHRFSWNNGAIIEYWKSFGKTSGNFDNRIGVRFGEFKNVPLTVCTVWLFFPRYMHSLRHITTIEEVEQLHALLSGCKPREEPEP